ncbi:hypothetical protein BBK82_41085 [Lentzea guizhouensis]|uniref:NACHT domain-containing protein n=1 Tax=Lentzea guizhouensis TaxID=1586287 RepID=A0A1B2HUQ1_9PSEU|nr:NACHT domain-containing protein [Lentzea guizhouensis]ANZ41412.1 hypothetical protein BBK82_41085 [Lentzea guizhouensis]
MAQEDHTANSMGDVHGIGFQARNIHGDVHITHAPPATPPVPPCPPPADWASTTALPAAVQDLLWAQEECAELLPYQLPGARKPSLGAIYVRQDVGSGVEDAQPEQRPTPMLDEHGRLVEMPPNSVVRVAVRPPSKPMRAALDSDDHLVITGGPGQGKSTLTLRLTADIIRQWATKSDDAPMAEPVLPLRIPARVLAEHLGPSFTQALADSAAAEYGHLLVGPLDPALFGTRVAGCRWLLLVDALDEVADPRTRAKIVHTLAAWAKKSTYRVLLTTRPTEGGALASLQRIACRYELQTFDDEALRGFATSWFDEEGEDCANRFLQQVRGAHLFELVEIPLLATIAAIVFEQHAQKPLPGNQYELYEAYLAHIRKPESTPATFERHRVPLIEHLGRTRLESDTSLIEAIHTWARQHPDAGPAADLITHLKACGLFVQRGRDLAFLHHSFAEHVAATAMARELPAEFAPAHPAFAELLHQAQPFESGRFARAVLLHHTRLHVQEADRLLDWLRAGQAEQHLLAARLLAKHLPAGSALVDEFLTVAKAWAMTTQYPARLMVSQVSRATHHDGLTDWLAELMRDQLAPFESRAEAAEALVVRLRAAHLTEALVLLKSAVDDGSAAVRHRLMAAEALAHSGSAEREAAERGLRSVLGDLLASGNDCRTAAVVLAAFGGKARDFAVAALERVLSDLGSTNAELVQAATGLIEIDAEFHGRCTEVLLGVVRDPVHNMFGKRDAVLGLMALGEQESAAEAITEVVRDRRRPAGNRADAAVTLALLGPRMRAKAGELLLACIDAFDTAPSDRWWYVKSLVKAGRRDLAVDLMRGLLAAPHTSWIDVVAIAAELGDLGPAFHDEAAVHLERAHRYGPKLRFEFVYPLRELADLGESHRATATARLRAALTDLSLDPDTRCQVANELIRCAPEFHALAGEHLLAIASSERDPDVRAKAWAGLHRLGPVLAGRALRELLVLARDHEVLSEIGSVFAFASAEHRRAAADELTALVQDRQRSLRTRLYAVQGLVTLGRAFHRVALAGVLEPLRTGLIRDPSSTARYFASTGRGVRDDLAAALLELFRIPGTTPEHRWLVVKALELLGHEPPLEVLQDIAADESAGLGTRAEAAVKAADANPAQLESAVDVVFVASSVMNIHRWKHLVGHLAHFGVDVRARLQRVVASPDSSRNETADAASLVDSQALRACSEDEYSRFSFRLYAYGLRALNGDSAPAVRYFRSVLDDPDESVTNRCSAAVELADLDQTLQEQMTEVVWRFAESRHLRLSERVDATKTLLGLAPSGSPRLTDLIMALVRDPERSDEAAAALAAYLPRAERTTVERVLLADRWASLEDRMPRPDGWGDVPLLAEAEAAAHEVTRLPEHDDTNGRAALALAGYSFSHAAEAVSLLIADGSLTALKKAAELGAWPEVHARLRTLVLDENRPMRDRRGAALVICDVAHEPSVRDFLLNDVDASWRHRVKELRSLEAFSELRRIRDNPALSPQHRREAARFLLHRSIDDRAACARLFASIAADHAVNPVLRWWAADDLSDLGARGRAEALPLLDSIARDNALPVLARSNAAWIIGQRWPTRHGEVLEVLRDLLPLAKPLQRVQVLDAIAVFRTSEAADELSAMAMDPGFGPLVRLHAAAKMAVKRLDLWDRAALVARDVAFDQSAPTHVRQHAARLLARWSEVCREDARGLLRTLRLPCGLR